MNDIEKLIKRLHSVTTETAGDEAAVDEAADALTRLAARTLESLSEGRLDGIREAIAIVGSIGFGCESCIAEALARLSALLPLTSGGEKAECTCDGSGWKKIGSYQSACPADVHGQDACKLEIDVSSLRTELAECKAQNRAMAETMSAFAKLDAKEG